MLTINDIDTEKDYYKILNVSRNASIDQIKRAYKKLMMKYHPDTAKGTNSSIEKFHEIRNAYEILAKPHLKQAYDTFLTLKIPPRYI